GMLDDMPAGHYVEGLGWKASLPDFPLHHHKPMARRGLNCVRRELCACDLPPAPLRHLEKHTSPTPHIQELARRLHQAFHSPHPARPDPLSLRSLIFPRSIVSLSIGLL